MSYLLNGLKWLIFREMKVSFRQVPRELLCPQIEVPQNTQPAKEKCSRVCISVCMYVGLGNALFSTKLN